MKHRAIPSDIHNDLRVAALCMGLISAGVDFDYRKCENIHQLRAYTIGGAPVPDSCEPEKWTD